MSEAPAANKRLTGLPVAWLAGLAIFLVLALSAGVWFVVQKNYKLGLWGVEHQSFIAIRLSVWGEEIEYKYVMMRYPYVSHIGRLLEEAVTQDKIKSHKILINVCSHTSPSTKKHLTSLALLNKEEMAKHVLALGVDPTEAFQAIDSHIPFYRDMAKLLVEAGAKNTEKTLEIVATHNDAEMVDFLIKHGADPKIALKALKSLSRQSPQVIQGIELLSQYLPESPPAPVAP